MQPGVLKVSQECRGMNKSKCYQLRQFVFIPAWRSNLLHHIEFAMFFLVPSQAFTIFCGPLLHPQTEPIKHCFDFSAHTVLPWPLRKSCLCFCLGLFWRTHSDPFLHPLWRPCSIRCLSHFFHYSQSFLHCFSLFSVSPYLKKKKVRKKHVSGAVYIYPGSILGSGRSPGGGNGKPLQYSCLENPMDRGAWQATAYGVTKSWTWLSNWAHGSFAPHRPCILKL